MTSPRVRAATPADAEAITAVHLASRAAAMPWLPRLHTDEETLAWIRDLVLPGSLVWVAEEVFPEDDGGTVRVAGFAALDGGVLDQLYLLPEVRRRGIGTLLLETVRAASPRGLTLQVFARNAAARAFYAHHGFEVVTTDEGSGTEEGLPDVTLRWQPVRRGGAHPGQRSGSAPQSCPRPSSRSAPSGTTSPRSWTGSSVSTSGSSSPGTGATPPW